MKNNTLQIQNAHFQITFTWLAQCNLCTRIFKMNLVQPLIIQPVIRANHLLKMTLRRSPSMSFDSRVSACQRWTPASPNDFTVTLISMLNLCWHLSPSFPQRTAQTVSGFIAPALPVSVQTSPPVKHLYANLECSPLYLLRSDSVQSSTMLRCEGFVVVVVFGM